MNMEIVDARMGSLETALCVKVSKERLIMKTDDTSV